jgi:hypothetical protein
MKILKKRRPTKTKRNDADTRKKRNDADTTKKSPGSWHAQSAMAAAKLKNPVHIAKEVEGIGVGAKTKRILVRIVEAVEPGPIRAGAVEVQASSKAFGPRTTSWEAGGGHRGT